MTTKAALLQALLGRPSYGRDIIVRVLRDCGIPLKVGSVYPALYGLEEDGLVRVRRTKDQPLGTECYQLTKRGERMADEHRRKVALLYGLARGLQHERAA